MRSPLELIGLAARRGEEDLLLLAEVARGRRIDEQRARELTRAGLLRGQGRSLLPARLILPLLAVEEMISLKGAKLLAALTGRLSTASEEPAEQEMLLGALAEEISEQIAAFGEEQAPATDLEQLAQVLAQLKQTLDGLSDPQVDPAQVMRVSILAGRLAGLCARKLQSPRRRRPRRLLPQASVCELAACAGDLAFALPKLVSLPSEEALARALAGTRLPLTSAQARQLPADPRADRGAELERALRSPRPLQALYAGQTLQEALRRHVALSGMSAQLRRSLGVEPLAQVVSGPDPLIWSTEIQSVAQADALAA